MAIEAWERFGSRESSSAKRGSSSDLKYIARGSNDHAAVRQFVFDLLPIGFDGLELQNLHLEQIGDGLWEASARFGDPDEEESQEPPETGDSSISFDTAGGSTHITQSYETHDYGSDPPAFGGAIGVTDDAVEGVDITIPSLRFSETHYLPAAMVTQAYIVTVSRLTGKVCNHGFRGFDAGEILFAGASGSKRGRGDWEVTFNFEVSENEQNLSVGSIHNIQKNGWWYLWALYKDREDPNARAVIKKPVAVYVERVYPEASFAPLGIGS